MVTLHRIGFFAVLALGLAAPARAAVQVTMRVEGARGPFATKDAGVPTEMKVTSVQLDLASPSDAPLAVPRPIVVNRPVDELSWQFLDAVGSNDVLRVVITVAQTSPDGGVPQRRVITLTSARILSIHAALDANPGARAGLGQESIALTYGRIEVEDDGAKVFAAGT